MIDISGKIETLRTAIAVSRVMAKEETIQKILKGETPKGEVLSIARAATVMATKKTSELIPYCHPLLLDQVLVTFEPHPGEIEVRVLVKAIGRTGVEMEALTGAMMGALTIYDMAKGIDKDIIIGETKLLEKEGGKSDYQEIFLSPLKAAILVSSDSVSQGKKTDKSGKMIVEAMKKFPVEVLHYEILPDEPEKISKTISAWVENKIDLILTTGGTGLGPRDVTVETLQKMGGREVSGIAEAMRSFGQRRTPYAMLSRGTATIFRNSLVITLPGSSRGVQECLQSLFPNVLHAFNMMRGGGH